MPARSLVFHAFAWSSSTLRMACSASFGPGAAASSNSSVVMTNSLRDLGGRDRRVVGQPLMYAVAVDLQAEVRRPRRRLELQVGRHAGVAVVLQHLALVVEDAGAVSDVGILVD